MQSLAHDVGRDEAPGAADALTQPEHGAREVGRHVDGAGVGAGRRRAARHHGAREHGRRRRGVTRGVAQHEQQRRWQEVCCTHGSGRW